MDQIFFNLFELDLEDEEDSIFARILKRKLSKYGVEAMVLLSFEELREIKEKLDKQAENLPSCLFSKMKALQFYLKHLHAKYLFSIDGSFDYSSIDESESRKLTTTLLQFSKLVVTETLELSHHLH